jgi:hypothetical protein
VQAGKHETISYLAPHSTPTECDGFASKVVSACEAGESIKPGARAPGNSEQDSEPVITVDSSLSSSAFARIRGLLIAIVHP